TKSPQWMVEQSRRVARESGLEMRTRDHRALAREGFGGLIGVGQGSARPPRLVELTYRPDHRRSSALPHVVLVGKGITFDTGGISIKPPAAMTAMKTDMAGAGAVLAVLGALRALDVQVRVTGLLALAENMPSGGAQRPGDVLTQYGGTTVEVLNTDAEGRLVLADALAYAVSRLRPDTVVDLATLTGAVGIALGRRDAGLFATDERLAARLVAAAAASGERVWRLPLVEDYRPALDSSVADLANIAVRPAPGAGAVLAGLFLREFVGQVPWAHLDIAGTGRSEVDDHEISRGGTGFGVRLLLSWLESGRLR
ncbi:MAG TPA: M17 family metallopeptidase, partial [Ornithinibacter sp.]|nr:M17 family metallopeptidase [Ornithinibacter sp.]